MDTKHTPGPWTNHGRITGPGLPHSAVAAETLIARVFSKHFGDVEQEVANANLIAAAPDMALVLEIIAADDDAARNHGRPFLTSAVRMALDAALIKAGRKAAPQPRTPRFASTSCSQCGADLGPGDSGVSSCADHAPVKHVRICGEGL